MKRGIPRAGGIPRPGGSRLVRPVAVVQTPVLQAPRRVVVPAKTAPKVRSAPVITAAPKSTSRIIARGPAPQLLSKPTPVVRNLQVPSRPLGFSRRVARAAPVVAPVVSPVAAPVVSIPAAPVVSPVSVPVVSPVRVGNNIVMVPDEVVVTPQRSPVQVIAAPRTPPSVAAPVVYSPVSPLSTTMAPEEFSYCLSPPSPVGRLDFSFSPVFANPISNEPITLVPDPGARSPFVYGYGEVSPIAEEVMPEEFSMFAPYDDPLFFNESVLLQSPILEATQPVMSDVALDWLDPMLSPVGTSRGFLRGRARDTIARELFSEPYFGNTTIEWESPEDLVNEYNNRILAPPYQDDLMAFSPGDLMSFSPPGDLINFGSPTELINFGSPTDLIQFW